MAVAATYVVQAPAVYGVPAAGTDAVSTITIGGTPDGGTFRLAHEGFVSGSIAWSAVNTTLRDNVDAALEALPSLGTGGVVVAVGTMTAGIGTLTVTCAGGHAKRKKGPLSVAYNLLTGTAPTVEVAETTPGVDAYGIGLPPDTVVINAVTGLAYRNTGTAVSPVWTAF